MRNYREQTDAAHLAPRRCERERSIQENRRNCYAECEHPATPRYRGDTGSTANTPEGSRRNQYIYANGFRGKGPRNYKRSDERIYAIVCDLLCDNPYLDASGITVEVQSGNVVLTGYVDNRFSRQLAEHLVQRVSGVINLENRIYVNQDNTHLQKQKHVRLNIV